MNISTIRSIVFLCTLLVSLNSFGSCEEAIKEFYVAYMQNAECGNDDANIKLKEAHMSPEVIDLIDKYTQQYDADALIHAQDVSKHGIETLTVIPLKDDWYLVKYYWDADSKVTMIPIQACDCDSGLQILDILPEGTDNKGESYIKKHHLKKVAKSKQ